MISSFFRSMKNTSSSITRTMPMLNEIGTTVSNIFASYGQIQRKKRLMKWFKGLPELNALTNKVAKDIVYKWHFEPIQPNSNNRNKIMAANKFATNTNLRKIMYSQVIDQLITGEGFGFVGKLTKKQIKEAFLNTLSKKGIQGKQAQSYEQMFDMEFKQVDGFNGFLDEDVKAPKKYSSIASSTVEVIHDEHSVTNYVQEVNGERVPFTTEEIIHYSFTDVDGKVNGFTPIESCLTQLELLRLMWENNTALHKNGGTMDKIFIAKNMQPNSPAYKHMFEQIQKYKLAENKHGNMLFTGDIDIKELAQMDDMQFQNQGLYITGVLAMQWQIPRSSIPYIVGGANTSDDTGGNSEKGYWRNIQFSQEMFAEIMNSQLFIPHFGVKIVFDNTYIQQDVQQETYNQMKLTNLLTTEELLTKSKLTLSKDKRLRLLGLTSVDVEDMPEEELMPDMTKNGMDNQLPKDADNSLSKQNVNARKKTEQVNTTNSTGMKPTGVGKELKDPKIEIKELKMHEAIDVDKRVFERLYNEDKSFNLNPPRMFMEKRTMETVFMYKSTDFVYRTSIDNMIDSSVFLMNVGQYLFEITDTSDPVMFLELDDESENEFKSIIGNDTEDIDINEFVTSHKESKVFMRESDDHMTLLFKEDDKVYKTKLESKEQIPFKKVYRL